MFGHRSDGYLIKQDDPIIGVVPHIMPNRADSQVMLTYEVDYATLARYVVAKEAEGCKVRVMDIVIAAFVRTVAELPELNRFIINKNTYARKTLSVSFAVLRSNGPSPSDVDENTTKCYFDPHDTIFDVSEYNKSGDTPASYASLSAALGDDGENVPSAMRKGGMTIKYIDSTSSQYVQWRYMGADVTDTDFTTLTNWQGIDADPIAGVEEYNMNLH